MAFQTPADTWSAVQQKIHQAVSGHFPKEGRTRKLVLHSIHIDDKDVPHDDIRGQEKAKLLKGTWGVPVYGDVSLVDKHTGKELDRAKVKLMNLPKPTNRFSFIIDGGEWQADNLWRLNSGIYAHVQQNGQAHAEFNLAKPFARENKLFIPFDPAKKQFNLRYAKNHIPLYSVLKVLGIQDEDMKKVWGEDIYKANVSQKNEANIRSFYDKVAKRGVRATGDSYDAVAGAVVKEFHNTQLLPEVTRAVLGKPIDHVNGEALLLASKRILDVTRGNIAPDDRNSLVYKKLDSIDDFLHRRLTNPATTRAINAKVSNNIDRPGMGVKDVISGDLFHKPMMEFFHKSPLARSPEQSNPIEILTNHRMTTILGGAEGGIKTEATITPEMKVVNPSHFGFLDPIHTPEGPRTGINLHLPLGVSKVGNEVRATVYDLKENKLVAVGPSELHSHNVLLPDQFTWEKGRPKPIAAQVKMKDPKTHEMETKPAGEARYALVSSHQLFNEATNLIPFLQNNQGNRTMVAARQLTQAVGLHHREPPLVQTHTGGEHSWEKVVGTPFSHLSKIDGSVIDIKKRENGHAESILLQDNQGTKHEVQLYNNFPLNDAKSFLHSEPKVQVGDKVTQGQVLADTNFTRDGHLALGTNLRVSYLPFKGYNFEDGIVISDSASKKLTSEHLHRKELELDPEKDIMSKQKFIAHASATAKKFTREQADKLDDHGVVRIGQKVQPGDVLVAAVGKKDLGADTAHLVSRLGKKVLDLQDKSVVWDSNHPGEVVNVVKHPSGKGASVFVRTLEPVEIGDKIVGRHGNKAIVSRILPDHEMPRIGGHDGEHVEVLMNPSGVPTRINLGQMLETAAAKVALKTGKPYFVNNFSGANHDYTQQVKDDLKKHGLSDTEELFDATTGKKLGDALTGQQYILKLKHQVEKKLSVRSHSQNYTLDGAPRGTGAEHPGQGLGQLEFYSLLSHGARHNLREMATYKADQHLDENQNKMAHYDFWQRVQTGQPLPAPKPTFAYRKFETLLKGLGVNVEKHGNELQLSPLTDKGVLALSNGEIKDAGLVVRGKDAKEYEKGLFDPKVTGGLPDAAGKGLKWAHITLAEPFPNPVFMGTRQHAGPIPILTGMKFSELEEIAHGKKFVDGKTGGAVIQDMLKSINVGAELKKTIEELPRLRGTPLDKANRKARYLMALEKTGLKPHEAYMMNYVPVIPPVFRPLAVLHDGTLKHDDVNQLYKNLGKTNDALKTRPKELPETVHQPLRMHVYEGLKNIAGLGGIPAYDSNRELKGILDIVSGQSSPKSGYFQSKIMKRRQELSMRSTIIPEPAMHLDHVGLPREAAMELYKPFVIRELTGFGYNPRSALEEVKKNSPLAARALQAAMDKRPVLLKRDPALHKFSIMAFKPKVVSGRAVQIHPLVTHGYNADFDGDTMSAYVPLTEEARLEAHKLFPSNNLFSPTTGSIMYSPDQEALLGLHLLGKWGKQSGKTFNTPEEAMKAKDKGVIGMNDVIRITHGPKATTLGRMAIVDALPDSANNEIGKKILETPELEVVKHARDGATHQIGIRNVLEDIAKKDPKNFAQTADALKNLGNQHSYDAGFSINLDDLHVNKKLRGEVLKKYDEEAERVKASKMPLVEKNQKLVELYNKATDELSKTFKGQYEKGDNNIYTMISSGARGKWDQFRQMTIAPMLMKSGTGETLPTPVKKSYAEGLDVGDYWTSLHGARMGTLQRAEGTSEPGRISKEIINVVIPNVVASKDCGTTQGITMGVHDSDIHDRYLAQPAKAGKETIPSGTLITPQVTSMLAKAKVDRVVVRSPLKCSHGKGICSKCYGLNENGALHELGTNIGVIAGQALGEPAVQLAMDSFHSGGVAGSRGGASVDRLTRLDQLISVPRILPNSASLATTSGKVTKIEKDKATNGWKIFVNGELQTTSDKDVITAAAQRKPLVSVGSDVKRGDSLTDGPVNPRRLLDLTDIHRVQNYITDELNNAVYKSEGVKRRNIETVVRGLTNLTHIEDPGDSEHLSGDVALRTVIEEHNRNLKPGEMPVIHKPFVEGAQQTALDQHEDWLARLNFQRLRDTVLEGAAMGWKSDLHGTNPIPGYALGSEFGRGTPEKPHHY